MLILELITWPGAGVNEAIYGFRVSQGGATSQGGVCTPMRVLGYAYRAFRSDCWFLLCPGSRKELQKDQSQSSPVSFEPVSLPQSLPVSLEPVSFHHRLESVSLCTRSENLFLGVRWLLLNAESWMRRRVQT